MRQNLHYSHECLHAGDRPGVADFGPGSDWSGDTFHGAVLWRIGDRGLESGLCLPGILPYMESVRERARPQGQDTQDTAG